MPRPVPGLESHVDSKDAHESAVAVQLSDYIARVRNGAEPTAKPMPQGKEPTIKILPPEQDPSVKPTHNRAELYTLNPIPYIPCFTRQSPRSPSAESPRARVPSPAAAGSPPAIVAVIERPLVHIHSDEFVRQARVEVPPELHRILERLLAVIEPYWMLS